MPSSACAFPKQLLIIINDSIFTSPKDVFVGAEESCSNVMLPFQINFVTIWEIIPDVSTKFHYKTLHSGLQVISRMKEDP